MQRMADLLLLAHKSARYFPGVDVKVTICATLKVASVATVNLDLLALVAALLGPVMWSATKARLALVHFQPA